MERSVFSFSPWNLHSGCVCGKGFIIYLTQRSSSFLGLPFPLPESSFPVRGINTTYILKTKLDPWDTLNITLPHLGGNAMLDIPAKKELMYKIILTTRCSYNEVILVITKYTCTFCFFFKSSSIPFWWHPDPG